MGGITRSVVFMVDTGADSTVIDQLSNRVTRGAMEQGTRSETTGVGGVWPTRVFHQGATLTVLGEDRERGDEVTIRFHLPKLQILAGHRDRNARGMDEHIGRVAPDDRRLQGDNPELEACKPIKLLGRDFFYENHLALDWNPREESAILLQRDPQEMPTAEAPEVLGAD